MRGGRGMTLFVKKKAPTDFLTFHRLNTEFICQVHGLKVIVVVAVGSLPRTVPAEASNACCNYALINLALTLINKC